MDASLSFDRARDAFCRWVDIFVAQVVEAVSSSDIVAEMRRPLQTVENDAEEHFLWSVPLLADSLIVGKEGSSATATWAEQTAMQRAVKRGSPIVLLIISMSLIMWPLFSSQTAKGSNAC